jgi:hypothetical protein
MSKCQLGVKPTSRVTQRHSNRVVLWPGGADVGLERNTGRLDGLRWT